MDISASNPFTHAYQGIQNGYSQLNKDSAVLASPNQPDKTEALVHLNQNETQVQASAKAVKAADETLGTIIDIMA